MTVKEANDKLVTAQRAYSEIKRKISDMEHEQTEELLALKAAHQSAIRAAFGEERDAAARAVYDARQTLDAALIAEAETKRPDFPDVVYAQWDRSYSCYPWHATGRRGRLVVFREEDGCTSRYGKPLPGDWVIREIKKDGTFSKRCHRFFLGKLPTGWFPEGETPGKNS